MGSPSLLGGPMRGEGKQGRTTLKGVRNSPGALGLPGTRARDCTNTEAKPLSPDLSPGLPKRKALTLEALPLADGAFGHGSADGVFIDRVWRQSVPVIN